MWKTVSALYGFFLAMLHYPHVQQKGQAELESVIGLDRFPTLDDHDSLPYISAIAKEILRWNTPLNLGMQPNSARTASKLNVFVSIYRLTSRIFSR